MPLEEPANDAGQRPVANRGVEASPFFVREPAANGVAERIICNRTLGQKLLWVRPFETIEVLRLALLADGPTLHS